jgi:hypothetical protein
MTIILKGGPLDGETDEVSAYCVIYRRRAAGPNARYRTTGSDDAKKRRIFEHWPPTPSEPEPNEGIHDA